MNTRAIGFMIYAVAGLFCGFRIFHDDGIVGLTKKPLIAPPFARHGCFCHNDSASSDVRVWITGPETLTVENEALYNINVARDSGIAAGFDVAAYYGDIGVFDSTDTQLMRIDKFNPVDSLELTHTDPKPAGDHDTISWSFYYRAPSIAGVTDTIYANGNSVNLNLDPDGDYWNYAPNFLVHILSPTHVAETQTVRSFHLMQNYPNPFNPSTQIRFEVPFSGWVNITVYDMSGRTVQELVNEHFDGGSHEAEFVAKGARVLASGVYFYRISLQSPGTAHESPLVETRKMLLLK